MQCFFEKIREESRSFLRLLFANFEIFSWKHFENTLKISIMLSMTLKYFVKFQNIAEDSEGFWTGQKCEFIIIFENFHSMNVQGQLFGK